MTDTVQLKPGSDKWKEWRRLCTEPEPGRRSALYFLNQKVLGHDQLGDFRMTPDSHYALCLFAERATGIDWIDNAQVHMMMMPRGTGKSTLVTKGLAIQQLLKHDDYAIGIANETMNLAKKFLANVKLEFETNEFLQALFPERIPDDFSDTTWKAEEIVIKRQNPRPKDPSVLATGAGGTVTGVHMDRWILDDLISRDLAENALRGHTTEMEKMERWITQLPPLLGSPTKDPIDIACTPWYEGDTYDFCQRYFGNVSKGVDLEDAERRETLWQLKLPNGKKQTQKLHRIGDIAIFKKPALDDRGESAFPWKWSTEELNKMRHRPESAAFFAANYLLEPSEGLASAFEIDWIESKTFAWDGDYSIRFYDSTGEPRQEYIQDMVTFVSCDPAFSDKQSAARTAIVVCATNGREIFLLEDFAEHGLGTYDIAEKIVDFSFRYDPQTVYLETIASQAALTEPIQRTASEEGLQLHIEEISRHSERNKEMRILGLERWFRKGLFYHHPSHSRFLKEYESFPRGQLRDVLDALTFQREGWQRATRIGQRRSNVDGNAIQQAHHEQAAKIREELA